MAAISFKRSSLEDFNKYNSLLVGNAFTPPPVPSAYDLLETTELASSASSVSFTGLGSYTDYKHLQIRLTGRSTTSGTNFDYIYMQFNNDTSSNYSWHQLVGEAGGVSSAPGTNQSFMRQGAVARNGETSNKFSAAIIDILDPFSTDKNTTTRSLSGLATNVIRLDSGSWRNTSSLTDINLSPEASSFVSGSRFSLYGIRG